MPQTSFVTLRCAARNRYSGTDTVTYELPDSAKERGEEILPCVLWGPPQRGLWESSGLTRVKREAGTPLKVRSSCKAS